MSTVRRLLTAALEGAGFAAALASYAIPARADAPLALSLAPMQAQSLDVGHKHIVTYFLGERGICRLTLMIADVDDDASVLASRLQLVIEAGRSASLDTAQGASLAFNCDNRAQSMHVTRIDRFVGPHQTN